MHLLVVAGMLGVGKTSVILKLLEPMIERQTRVVVIEPLSSRCPPPQYDVIIYNTHVPILTLSYHNHLRILFLIPTPYSVTAKPTHLFVGYIFVIREDTILITTERIFD